MPSSPTLEPLSPSGMSRTRSRIKPVDSAGVRKAFLNFFATLLEKYRTYVLDAAMHTAMSPAGVQGSSSAPAALFDTEAFLQAAPEKHREYLHSIVNTISFMRWVEVPITQPGPMYRHHSTWPHVSLLQHPQAVSFRTWP